MSKLFLFITAASLFLTCACQKMDNMPTDSLKDIQNLETKGEVPLNPLDRFAVSLNDAKRYAELYRPGDSFVVSPYVEGRDTLLYVFNYKEGWMVLSGDRRTYPVIAQGAKGSIKINETSGYGFWLKLYALGISELKIDETKKENEYTVIWKALSPARTGPKRPATKADAKWVIREAMINEFSDYVATVPPLIQTKWGQQAPWNNNYPLDTYYNNKCYVGCEAVALAQVLYYWHNYAGVPTKLFHTISSSNSIYSGYVYSDGFLTINYVEDIGFFRNNETNNSSRWNDMALSATSGGNTGYVGDFMLDIGNRIGMSYTGVASKASFLNAATPLAQYYGFSYNYRHAPAESYIKEQLQYNRPVIIRSTSSYSSSGGTINHTWVIDGYTSEHQYYSMLRYCELSTEWGLDDEVYDTFEEAQAVYGFSAPYDMLPFSREIVRDHLHMNWGEDGEGDGIYSSLNWYYAEYGCVFSHTDMDTCSLYFN